MTTTRFVWDIDCDAYLMEKNIFGATTAEYTTSLRATDGPLSASILDKCRYYHYDAQGCTRHLTNIAQEATDTYVFQAYGGLVASVTTLEQPFQYCGQYGYYTQPEVTELYVRARFYQPTTSRWLSQDPIAVAGNLYSYVDQRPITNVDPQGLQTLPPVPIPIPVPGCRLEDVQTNVEHFLPPLGRKAADRCRIVLFDGNDESHGNKFRDFAPKVYGQPGVNLGIRVLNVDEAGRGLDAAVNAAQKAGCCISSLTLMDHGYAGRLDMGKSKTPISDDAIVNLCKVMCKNSDIQFYQCGGTIRSKGRDYETTIDKFLRLCNKISRYRGCTGCYYWKRFPPRCSGLEQVIGADGIIISQSDGADSGIRDKLR